DGDQRAAARFERGVRRALRAAARIITPSAFTRDELVSRIGADRSRICIVPWAPDTALTAAVSDFERSQADARIRSAFDLRGHWILNFSGRTKRKNAARLIEAFGRLPAAILDAVCLVLTGCEPETTRVELTRLAQASGVADRCRILGFLPETDVAALLRGAAGMALPSLAEGFGLPVLDAMACGVPVLASEATSLEEVARDAAIYVDPHSVASICGGLERLLDDRDRAERVARGYARASTYSWERTAAALADVYDQCASDRQRAAFAEPPTGAAEGRA
ncbi:MAG: glycosyltransferase family 4 protein, partial [Planctomycetes bacterium]|nr:glycosyltransferase family 4 protein [Planctomycetota bacterium]